MEKRYHRFDRPAQRSTARLLAVLMSAGTLFGSNAASAADGDPDPTFGTGGFQLAGVTAVRFELPGKPVVQPDGKILLCSVLDSAGPSGSDFFVMRFNADGSLDNGFNFDGKVTIDFDSRNDACNAVAVQADGKIIVIGSSADALPNSDFAAARLGTDGTLDPTFGAGTGKTLVPFDLGDTNNDIGGAVAMQADGKIVIAGIIDTAANGDDFGVVRLLPDGTRDTTFNSTGRVDIGFDFAAATNKMDQADAVAIDDAGNILVSGIAQTDGAGFDFAVARLTPAGQLDTNFDADGRATLPFDLGNSNSEVAYAMILQRDGKIVMAGAADTGTSEQNNDVAIGRLLQDGSPDPQFGIGGKVVVPFDVITNGNDVATGVVEDSAGRIVLGGAVTIDDVFNFHPFALRLTRDGNLDESFGVFGKKVYDFGGTANLFLGIALQGTQIIAGGQVSTATEADNFVARLLVDQIFANGFE
jgi:uncharacterized delta-60 repeat protein